MDESSRRPRQVDGDGAAKRRRLRRLRSWCRHEQQTVAAVLATYQHHSAPRGPRTARTGGERETNYTATLRKMLPPRRQVPGTLRWTLARTWVRHQPPGGQHRCLRCCRRNGYSSTPQCRSSTLCRWSRCFMRCCRSGTVGGHSRTSRFPCC